MKNKPSVIFFLFLFQLGYTQTEKLIQGRVLCEDFPLQGVEVVNLVSEKHTTTNSNGEFSILAKADNMLVFISKKYDYKRVILDKELLDKNSLIILLTQKPEELEEVVVFTKTVFPKIKFDKNIASQLNIEKAAKNPKPFGVYDGTIENGIGMIINLSGNRKKPKEIKFKELATATCTQEYFNKTLGLKPEEIALFLEFCDADPKSKIILENSNPLSIMDFLFTKNDEFKKLNSVEKSE